MQTPTLIVISAPSGCGKTTIAREILKRHPKLTFSISATTRKPRDGEIHGRDYYFLSVEEFKDKIRNNEFIEWEYIYTDYYGSLVSEVERAQREGKSILFDIDVKGALSIKRRYPQYAVLIFIKPPRLDILIQRLSKRKTEEETAMQQRLERVPMEMSKENEFDYCVINDELDKAIEEVENIITKYIYKHGEI